LRAPPAQNRTRPIKAYGSHLGCLTAKPLAPGMKYTRFGAYGDAPHNYHELQSVLAEPPRPVKCTVTFTEPRAASRMSAAHAGTMLMHRSAELSEMPLNDSVCLGRKHF
jgi:hypothetical protein